jgi:thioredoxin reductase (NADPH)
MAKPVLFAVDDEPTVLRAVERDLSKKWAKDFRILGADSGAKALAALEELHVRGDPVALLLVDQRMPGMTGVELLEKAVPLFPAAKRVLLTAYADTDAAIRAINHARLDYYLLKPWDPPEEKLYPILGDLLEDWRASFHPPFEGIRVLGTRWSAEAHRVRDFLARNQVPFKFYDVEADPEAKRLAASAGAKPADLPLVLLPDGARLASPENREIAEKVGLRTKATLDFYDLVVVGAGPAGLAAAVYGACDGLKVLVIESQAPGGQAGMSSRIENYLGFPAGLSGADLARRAATQAARFGAETLTSQEVVSIRAADPYRIVKLSGGAEIACHVVLVATGVSYRKLDVPGIESLTGRGVYYGAALTEAIACSEQSVYVVGGGNSAGQGAIHLADHAATVTMLIRGPSLAQTMSHYLVDRIERHPKIRVRTNARITSVEGEESLRAIVIEGEGGSERAAAGAVFLFIGAVPRTDWLPPEVARVDGFVLTGGDLPRTGTRPRGWTLEREPFLLETSVPGIFAAGDVRWGSTKRVATAVGEGSMAVRFVHEYMASR